MTRQILLYITLLVSTLSIAQDFTQTIRGRIVDNESKFPLIGANVVLVSDTDNFIGTTADSAGFFKLQNIKVGRQSLKFTFTGYDPMVVSEILVSTGKESIVNVALRESVTTMASVEITATKNRGDALNEMAVISSRSFTVDETEKYAGTRGDPARMAAYYAGVQGSDDSRNDIVVRGNSPLGLLWRFEGVDIPNPNHFSVSGSTGGAISIINNKTLANSDFYTGAFPAEFGNTTAGVFDLRMRNGNNEKHERSFQFGFFGTEAMLEGPISKEKKSSYLINYRYATVTLFRHLGVDIGTSAKLIYQDGSFKFNFPTKNNGNFSVFGLGGASKIDIMITEQLPEEREIYGNNDRDTHFGTSMRVVGMNYSKSFNAKTYAKFTVATTYERQRSLHEKIYNSTDSLGNTLLDSDGYYVVDSLVDMVGYNFIQDKVVASFMVNHKFNAKHILKSGVTTNTYLFNFADSIYGLNTTFEWEPRLNHQTSAMLIQPYAQWKYRMNGNFMITAGLHAQYLTLNNSASLFEPRLGARWDISPKSAITFGYGWHTQMQPTYTYFYQKKDSHGDYQMHNRNTDFTKSLHNVVGYNYQLTKNIRIKAEGYYQLLKNVPIERNISAFSLVNQGSGYDRFFPDSLANVGSATNKGIEISIDRTFANKYFFMLNGTFYQSQYYGSDGVQRDTDFNGKYAVNVLGSKVFTVKDKNLFTVGINVVAAGNKRFGPVDTLASNLTGDIVYVDSLRNSLPMKPYFRPDLKINYKVNNEKVSHEIGIDIVNIIGYQNVLKLTYAPNPNDPTEEPIRTENQLGRLTIFYYKLDF